MVPQATSSHNSLSGIITTLPMKSFSVKQPHAAQECCEIQCQKEQLDIHVPGFKLEGTRQFHPHLPGPLPSL